MTFNIVYMILDKKDHTTTCFLSNNYKYINLKLPNKSLLELR